MFTPLRILIVEDSLTDTELILYELRSAGIEPDWQRVDTESDYLARLTAGLDVIISDFNMPQFGAMRALQLLQEHSLDIPLIIVTGSISEEVAVECVKQGAADYLLKDRLMRLPQAVMQVIQQKKLHDEKRQAEIQLQQQLESDRLLETIAIQIGQSLNLTEIFNTTVDKVRHFLQAERVAIYRFLPNQNGLLVAESVDFNCTVDSATNIHRTWSQDWASKQGDVDTVDDINQADIAPNVKLMTQFQVETTLVIPIFQGNRQWGLLAVEQCSKPRQWQPTEIDLLERLATQVAIAIQHAQLFNQVQQQSNREQLLNQISQALNSSLDPEHILQEIVNLLGKNFGVDRVSIFSIDTEHIRVLNEWRVSDSVISLLDWKTVLSEHFELLDPNSNFSLHRTFHAPNYVEDALRPKRLVRKLQPQSLSVLRVPIFIRDQLFGGISLQTTTTYRSFSKEEIHLLQRIASKAALALYNAQSYERLEQLVKERTEELEQEKLSSEVANRAKSEFLTNMSHELRTPLTSILGFSRMLQKQIFGSLNEKQKQYIERIFVSGEYLLSLINDLLDLAKIEAGKEELTLETLEVGDMCQECISLTQEQADSRGLELVLSIDSDVTICIADRRRLKQMLFNLLSNAVKFTETGSIALKITKTKATIIFSVIDTGIGISEVDQALLFDPFRQLDNNLARKYQGTGLGLALTRSLAQLHGGDITVKSELGGGSCFTLSLPFTPPG